MVRVRLSYEHGSYTLHGPNGREVSTNTDWEYPSLATLFGWQACHCGASDGTVDCEDCNRNAGDMIYEASQYLDSVVANGDVHDLRSAGDHFPGLPWKYRHPDTPDAPFWLAILKRKRDMRQRLVYADWLDEHGRTQDAMFWRWSAHHQLWPATWVRTDGGRPAALTVDWLAETGRVPINDEQSDGVRDRWLPKWGTNPRLPTRVWMYLDTMPRHPLVLNHYSVYRDVVCFTDHLGPGPPRWERHYLEATAECWKLALDAWGRGGFLACIPELKRLHLYDGDNVPVRQPLSFVTGMMKDGRPPAFDWPGGYPVAYVMADAGQLCADCANGKNGSMVNDPDCWDDKQWVIVGQQLIEPHDGDPYQQCDHCNGTI